MENKINIDYEEFSKNFTNLEDYLSSEGYVLTDYDREKLSSTEKAVDCVKYIENNICRRKK